MSRLFITKEEEEKVQGLLAILKKAEKQTQETVAVAKTSIHELAGLMEQLLAEKPIVLEKDLSPSEAGEIAQISRPFVMHLMKAGTLKGYPVGSHWRIKKESLIKYMEERESLSQALGEMDKDGFGLG
ncbi:MAG: helix-turn-helix domain-containing protein [Bdellovibrionales bacterium]|nr:helix-turn-helix domain-containing protein [Bdellovibrionales bacterium]